MKNDSKWFCWFVCSAGRMQFCQKQISASVITMAAMFWLHLYRKFDLDCIENVATRFFLLSLCVEFQIAIPFTFAFAFLMSKQKSNAHYFREMSSRNY